MGDSEIGEDFFSGLPIAMYNLLLVGNMPDQEPFVSAIAHDSIWLGAIILAFIFLGPLAIMGMLAGMLVEVVSVVSSVERESLAVQYVTEHLHRLLNDVDIDGDQNLTREEFQSFVVMPEAARMM